MDNYNYDAGDKELGTAIINNNNPNMQYLLEYWDINSVTTLNIRKDLSPQFNASIIPVYTNWIINKYIKEWCNGESIVDNFEFNNQKIAGF